jgi:hypothetical protein
MARPLRLKFCGATYHVMARGNQGQKICIDDHDREMWLATTVQAWKRTGWLTHAWAAERPVRLESAQMSVD